MSKIALGFRQVHLDFHTSGLIGDVGSRFDPDKFAAMVQAAHVDSVTCFAKCHHGQLYYNTRHPARHPGLPQGLDLLGEQVQALHKRGLRAPIYISVLCDEYAANTHPEWIVRLPDGGNRAPKPLEPGWQILDMASPYADYLAEQTAEIVEKFAPADGIFFDMCWNQPSVSNWAKAAMDAENLDPEQEADRQEYARRLSLDYMRQLSALCRKFSKKGSVYFNARPLTLLHQDLPYMSHVEMEALPSGGWGYMYFPYNVRYVRTFGVPYLGMTARFHKSWADFGGLKPEAALKYEICQMLAHGAGCSIGDQMHPRGTLDPVAWPLIGRVYGYAEACQPWCEGATSAAEIGLLRGPGGAYHVTAGGPEEGANRLLMQLKHQYDVLDTGGDFASYRLLILPDDLTVDAGLARRLKAFLAAGGAVLASGYAGLDAEGRVTWPALPVRGQAEPSPYTTTYLRPEKSLRDLLPPTDYVMYERGLRVAPARGAEVLARVVEPYFERSWRHFSSHHQTPPARLTNYPAALVKGRVAYIPYPIFSMYGHQASLANRALVQACLGRLLGRPMVEIDAPSFAEVSVMRHGRATVAHVLSWAVERRAANLDIVEDTVPLFNVRLSLALPKKPRRAYLAPTRAPLAFTWTQGRAETVIPRIDGHVMVVFE